VRLLSTALGGTSYAALYKASFTQSTDRLPHFFAFVSHHKNVTNFSITCNAEAWSPTSRPCELVHQKLIFVVVQNLKLFISFISWWPAGQRPSLGDVEDIQIYFVDS
jgi:hypothetical protein